MQIFHAMVLRVSKVMDVIGGAILTLMMLITVLDVVLRFLKKPITGTYELVFLGGAVVIGCAIPVTSLEGGHVCVDFLLEHFSAGIRKGFILFTRILGMAFFFLLGSNLFLLGTDLYKSGEVSLTLHVPYYPAAYLLALCAFVECLVLLSSFIKTISGGDHE
ncbi:MAG: TRAP transporter small permease [Syntrophobacterales bacterium]|jgi:TRAP-type C4-dicarboxylate transport system permease small subunit|nr:TRAP transporter small permease [Syntrophobacterales bacterium]